jgi:hypothetical protein
MRKTKTIRRMYSQSKTIVVLLFAGLIGMGVLSSCDKTKKFDGTVWVGELTDGGKITIFFTRNEAEFKIDNGPLYMKGAIITGEYSCKGRKITISINGSRTDESVRYIGDILRGNVMGKTMRLGINPQTIMTFKKQ